MERQLTPEDTPGQDTKGFQRSSSEYFVFWSVTESLRHSLPSPMQKAGLKFFSTAPRCEQGDPCFREEGMPTTCERWEPAGSSKEALLAGALQSGCFSPLEANFPLLRFSLGNSNHPLTSLHRGGSKGCVRNPTIPTKRDEDYECLKPGPFTPVTNLVGTGEGVHGSLPQRRRPHTWPAEDDGCPGRTGKDGSQRGASSTGNQRAGAARTPGSPGELRGGAHRRRPPRGGKGKGCRFRSTPRLRREWRSRPGRAPGDALGKALSSPPHPERGPLTLRRRGQGRAGPTRQSLRPGPQRTTAAAGGGSARRADGPGRAAPSRR